MKKYLGVFIGLLGGALSGFLMGMFLDFNYLMENPIRLLLFLIIGVGGGLLIHLAIHEAGHLVFGLCSGYSFQSYRIGNLMWVNEKGSIKFKRYELVGTAGQCLMGPPELKNGRIPVILYNLGGILANAILSGLCVLVAILSNNPLISDSAMVMALLGMIMVLSNGIPMRMGGVANDGYNVLYLNKDIHAVQAFYKQMKISEFLNKGYRYKDMPEELFHNAEGADLMNGLIATIEVFYCNRIMDAHQFEEAYNLMKELLSKETGILDVHRNQLINDCILCEYLMGIDYASRLTKEFKNFLKAMKTNPSIIRTNMILNPNPKRMDEFNKISKTYPYPSEIEMEKEFISMISPA